MNTHQERTSEIQDRSVTHAMLAQQGSMEVARFPDNRPEAIAQRKMQEMADNSQHAQRAAQLQALANWQLAAHVTEQQERTIQAQSNGIVVQRWLDQSLLTGRTKDKRTAALARLALDYNSNRKGKSREDRINELHVLQVEIMKWLDSFAVPDQNISEAATWAKSLMNEVQAEHQELVSTSIEQKDDKPPVANFDSLPVNEQKMVKHLWKQLVDGTGNIRITEKESFTNKNTGKHEDKDHDGFREQALAQFARLLETSTGRKIVSQLSQDTKGKKLITIRPGKAEDDNGAPGSEFAAGPVALDGSDKLTPVDINSMFKNAKDAKKKRENYRRKFIEINLARIIDPKEKAAAIYKAREDHPGMAGVKIDGKYYKFGKGTAVNVTMTRDIPDSDEHHTSRFVDGNKNEIPTPNFITLGHELGHAAHMLSGVALGDQGTNDQLFDKVSNGAREQDWSNLEEYANINSVENSIRNEFGMKDRYGHINQASVQKKRLDAVLEQLYTLSDQQPNNHRGVVEAVLGNANNSLAQLKIPPARKSLQDGADAFEANMHAAFPGFTQKEINDVGIQLTRMKKNVRSAEENKLTAAVDAIKEAIRLVKLAVARVQALQVQPVQQPPQNNGMFSGFLRFLGY